MQTNQTVKAVIEEKQKNSLFSQRQAELFAWQTRLHHALEELREVLGCFLKNLSRDKQQSVATDLVDTGIHVD